jgi:hypothetical protein
MAGVYPQNPTEYKRVLGAHFVMLHQMSYIGLVTNEF